MKKIIAASLALGLLAGCASTARSTDTAVADSLSAAERKKAKQDTRGHEARPMSGSRLQSILDEYSSNGDAVLTWAEYNDWRRARFDKTDANTNGTVDAEEYVYEFEGRLDDGYEKGREAHIQQTRRRFKVLDKDESAFIEWSEYKASGDRIFSRWDRNDDGVINEVDPDPSDKKSKDVKGVAQNDSDKYQHKTDHKKKERDNKNNAKRKSGFSFVKMPTTHSREGLMEIYDANDDKSVSSDEFVNERRSVFHLADQDKSGKLTLDEYLAEYEDRLDTKIASSRRAAIKQTYVRFKALDNDEDGMMTFDEFQTSGKRIFARWDKNGDGVVSRADIQK